MSRLRGAVNELCMKVGRYRSASGSARDIGERVAIAARMQLKRTDESVTVLRIVWRALPRNGGSALMLLCFYCNTPRRFVYGWEWDSFSGWSNRVRQVSWCCRSCNRLRYSSEGGYLRGSGRGAIAAFFRASFGNLPRPKSWLPYVFSS